MGLTILSRIKVVLEWSVLFSKPQINQKERESGGEEEGEREGESRKEEENSCL